MCYRGSTKRGTHMSVDDYETIMLQACDMHVLQVALGGGNPNQHPAFCEILALTRRKYGIVPNYTTNGRGLTDDVLKATKQFCGAVAVSAYYPYAEMSAAIEALTSRSIKTNVHFVLTRDSVETAIDWLLAPPSFLGQVNAIIFLNYKPVGRYPKLDLLLNRSGRVREFFKAATEKRFKFKVGFDACSVSGIAKFANVPGSFYDGCDAGRFSMFISEDMRMYPCSFMVADYDGVLIDGSNMRDRWQNDELFQRMRDKLGSSNCLECDQSHICRGGCPVFPEVNLCGEWNLGP